MVCFIRTLLNSSKVLYLHYAPCLYCFCLSFSLCMLVQILDWWQCGQLWWAVCSSGSLPFIFAIFVHYCCILIWQMKSVLFCSVIFCLLAPCGLRYPDALWDGGKTRLCLSSLSVGFFRMRSMLFTGDTFCSPLFRICMCSVSWLIWLSCQYQRKWLTGMTRLRNDL